MGSIGKSLIFSMKKTYCSLGPDVPLKDPDILKFDNSFMKTRNQQDQEIPGLGTKTTT
jgi:hypothetical protein